MRKSFGRALVFAAVFGASRSALGAGGAAADAYDGIRDDAPLDVHALADLYAQHALGAPSSAGPQLRAFDVTSDRVSLGLLHATLAHKPDVIGFRLDVGVGDMANAYLHFDPAAASHPGFSRGLSYIEQAFVTAILPVGRGLSVDVGRFGTPVGLEDNESLANWSYSRSLLYLLAEPSFHAGARITYATSDSFATSLFWVNGWDATIFDGDGMRSVAAAATWKPTAKLDVSAVYMAGPERAPTRITVPTLTLRHEVDVDAVCRLTDAVSLAGTGDYGHDAASGGVTWWGVGGYLRVQALPWLAAAVRGEHYADPDGFTSGTRQRLAEGTATLEARGQVGPVTWIGRLEYRRDQSDTRVFATETTAFATHQDTVAAALLVAY